MHKTKTRVKWIGLRVSMSERLWDRSLLATTLAVAIISAISVWMAWRASADFALRLTGLTLVCIFGAALVSYALRGLRFYYFLSRSGIVISLPGAIVAQMVGFALSVTPGRIGEVFKLHLIRERTGTPVVQTAPLLLLDRLTEGGGFMILALASTPLLPALRSRLPIPLLTLLGLAVILVFALTRDLWSAPVVVANPRLMGSRFGQYLVPHLKNLWHGVEMSFTPTQILGGLALSAVARFADGLVVLFTAQMLGVDLELPEAVFILAVSGLTGGVSFLPAGLGAVETTMIGLLVLVGAAWSNAVTIALVVRLFTLWFWVALGLGVIFLLRLPALRAHFHADEGS
jgi:uncharacterized protein (TIRG00374 family)